MGALDALLALVFIEAIICYLFFRSNVRYSKLVDDLTVDRDHYKRLWEEKKTTVMPLSAPEPVKAQKRVSSSQARRMVEQANAPYFSAEKRIPNSEVLKEQSNG